MDSTVEIGIHQDLPAEAYHALPYASASYLNALKRSPAHCHEAMTRPQEPTPAKVFGEAVHFCVLQPELFSSRYVVADQCSGMTGKGQRCKYMGCVCRGGEWFCKTHDPEPDAPPSAPTVLSQEDYDKCQCICDSVWSHTAARHLLTARKHTELSGVWTDSESGVTCKLRADIVCADIIADLKTTPDAGRETFERSILKFGYATQGCHYLHGLAALGLTPEHFCIVAVEKEPPFAVAAYRLLDEVIEMAADERRGLLAKFKRCQERDEWPGYSDEFQDIGIPRWAHVKETDTALLSI